MTGNTQLTLCGLFFFILGCAAVLLDDSMTHRVTNCTNLNSQWPAVSPSCSPGKLGEGIAQHHDRDMKKCAFSISLYFEDVRAYHAHCTGKPSCTMISYYRGCPCLTVGFNCTSQTTTTTTSTTPTVLPNAITVATDTPSQATAASGGRTIDRSQTTTTATSTTPTVLTNAITVATDTPSQATAASGGRTIDRSQTTTTTTSTTPTVLPNAITVATDTPSQATAASGGRTIDRNAPARSSSINLYAYIGIGVGVIVVMSILVAIACRQIRKQGDDNFGDASSGNSESYEAGDATLNKATETGTEAGQKKPGN